MTQAFIILVRQPLGINTTKLDSGPKKNISIGFEYQWNKVIKDINESMHKTIRESVDESEKRRYMLYLATTPLIFPLVPS